MASALLSLNTNNTVHNSKCAILTQEGKPDNVELGLYSFLESEMIADACDHKFKKRIDL